MDRRAQMTDLERGFDDTDASATRERGTIRLRAVLGVLSAVALVAFLIREPTHYRDEAFLAQVDRHYRKIQNDHAVAMYDRAVDDLSRVGATFPVQDESARDDGYVIVEEWTDRLFEPQPEDEDVDLTFWSAPPAQRPARFERRWFR